MNPTGAVVEDASPVDGSESESSSQPWLKSFFTRRPAGDVPALGGRAQIFRISLVVFVVLLVSFLASISLLGGMQQRSAQQKAFNSFRVELAEGTAPTGPVNVERQMIRPGTPMAYLEMPSIGSRQVVFAGTSSSITMNGPGYRMDTVFPGQVGTSIVMGRRASFGAPFGRLSELKVGDPIRVTTGQGEFEFSVIAVRSDGDPVPAKIEKGKSRIQIVTVDGRPFMPDGIVRVDAELEGNPVASSGAAFSSTALPASEKFMGVDSSTIWQLVLWLEALVVVMALFIWGWNRWSRMKTWIVVSPLLVLVGLAVSDQFARLLPNML
jgi:LPXTG-site transpeptidase (sortase) family protein